MTDTYSYRSATQGHMVTWTRDNQGIWHADDNRDMTATDEDIRQARSVDRLPSHPVR